MVKSLSPYLTSIVFSILGMLMLSLTGTLGRLMSRKESKQVKLVARTSSGRISSRYVNISVLSCNSCRHYANGSERYLPMRVMYPAPGMALAPLHAWPCDDTEFMTQWENLLSLFPEQHDQLLQADDLN